MFDRPTKGQRERRIFATRTTVEGRKLKGHAAVFSTFTNMGSYDEQIAPGAFTDALRKSDIRCLWNHNADYVLGRTKSGTLRVSEDEIGLAFECNLADTTLARDLITSVERGDVDQ